MLTVLIVLDVILALTIIGAVFLHQGPDGFIGDNSPGIGKAGVQFETFDKIIAMLVAGFFIITLSINYLHLYKDKGTASIDAILAKKTVLEEQKKLEEKVKIDAKDTAPLAE